MDALFAQLQNAVAGRFSLERELGRGGMAVVYLARDVALDRPVALKLLPPDLASQADSRERFLREARTAAGLAHPNIVPIHLVEEKNDVVYFVMAFVDGETLGERVRRAGPLTPADAGRIFREVAWALAYAHGRGIIHRDIKPDNILLEKGSGRAMVTDFGIARLVSRSTVSQQGEILGTIQYMSPEQADAGATVDGRSDLYSLGATAFYALTGRLPFEAPTAVALIAMHLTEPAPPITSVRDAIPPKLAEAVDRCLAKNPDARFVSAESLAETLGESFAVSRAVPPTALAFRDNLFQLVNMSMLIATAALLVREIAPAAAGPFGFLALAVVGINGLTGLGLARGCVRAGLSTRDLAEMFQALAAVPDVNVEMSQRQARWLGRLSRHPLARLAAGVIGLGYIVGGLAIARLLPTRTGLDLALLGFGAVVMIAGGVLFSAIALRLGPYSRKAEAERRGAGDLGYWAERRRRFARLLYDNPLTRLMFRIGGLGLRRRAAAPPIEQAATEVLLGRAADDLFTALPKHERALLRDVPDVIKALERTAQALRARRDELARAIGEAGQMGGTRRDQIVGELEAAKSEAAERLATAVTALENLRLDLLRLRAGVGSAEDLTGSLDEARRIGELVDARLALEDDQPSRTGTGSRGSA